MELDRVLMTLLIHSVSPPLGVEAGVNTSGLGSASNCVHRPKILPPRSIPKWRPPPLSVRFSGCPSSRKNSEAGVDCSGSALQFSNVNIRGGGRLLGMQLGYPEAAPAGRIDIGIRMAPGGPDDKVINKMVARTYLVFRRSIGFDSSWYHSEDRYT